TPGGENAKITLRRFHIDVHIENGFARTTIDQTYFNHESTPLEGTFSFPLPADALLWAEWEATFKHLSVGFALLNPPSRRKSSRNPDFSRVSWPSPTFRVS
ncbi:VIT domain-containing protein, partial [Klebsiella pneumoniae]|uniref:VIT domain-containing protein n=1 Tax=Klebsiella pneumoniae TaxID=573 RepID=UPI00313356B4